MLSITGYKTQLNKSAVQRVEFELIQLPLTILSDSLAFDFSADRYDSEGFALKGRLL